MIANQSYNFPKDNLLLYLLEEDYSKNFFVLVFYILVRFNQFKLQVKLNYCWLQRELNLGGKLQRLRKPEKNRIWSDSKLCNSAAILVSNKS